jgi:8-oxo-dGTP diphosphatase
MNNSIEKTKIVEVAAAVLLREGNGEAVGHPAASSLRGQRPDGSFLLAQRPLGKIWAGYWEFPGGKVEPGETAYHALVRELHEELGIAVQTAYPWLTRVFTYPHATVRLNFFRVTAWSGEPHPHEGQEFSWQCTPEVSVAPLLPANAPILRALALPPLYAISNVQELGEGEFMLRLEAALRNGLRLVQLREKHLSRDELRELALRVVEELRRAEELGCDFALLSPVLPTLSHPGAPHLGWEGFAAIAAGASIPVYALGGLSASDMETAWRHGAHGVALLRQAWPDNSSG